VFAISWKHPEDQILEWRHKSSMCAEVLVPDIVQPAQIVGVYVESETGKRRLSEIVPELPITINAYMFFR
jgi:hypothetical protein